MKLTLSYREPFAHAALWDALRAHTVEGLELHDRTNGTHTRVVNAKHGPTLVSVRVRPDQQHVEVELTGAHPGDVESLTAAVRAWLDLDADPSEIDRSLSRHDVLAPLVRLRPGLRRLGSIDGFEAAVLTVLGQQVSLAAARTFGSRLVATYGVPVSSGFRTFPDPATLAALSPGKIRATVGLTNARARTVHSLAQAASDGLSLQAETDPARFRAGLLAVSGIGPWTADYLAVRVLRDPDAFAPGDLVLRRALGVDTAMAATALANPWRPWRAYALFHLWTAQAY